MSDTPRTDAVLNAAVEHDYIQFVNLVDLCRQLERENAALLKAISAGNGEPVACRHEAYQGQCIHCNALYINGRCVVPPAKPCNLSPECRREYPTFRAPATTPDELSASLDEISAEGAGAADLVDADRYRWLRQMIYDERIIIGSDRMLHGEKLDAAIDAARAPAGKGGERGL